MPINTLEDLVYALLNEMGLGITPDGFLFDQDTYNIIQCGGYKIKASVDKYNPAISTDIYMAFDPVFDNKLMQYMLGYYLSKEENEGNISPLSVSEYSSEIPIYLREDYMRSKMNGVTVVCNGGVKYVSELYFQKGLKFSDVILRIGGNPYCSLHKFDSMPEEAIGVF